MTLFYFNHQNALRIFFPIQIFITNGYLTKENNQSILVLVVFDAIVPMACWCKTVEWDTNLVQDTP